mmetsp:Transcript_12535/g.39230  ORF Transcript_12535/g.39230 Transcript_12535/m.39230 type:complete len:219 (+) Transcript_12535:1550-2206(+)
MYDGLGDECCSLPIALLGLCKQAECLIGMLHCIVKVALCKEDLGQGVGHRGLAFGVGHRLECVKCLCRNLFSLLDTLGALVVSRLLHIEVKPCEGVEGSGFSRLAPSRAGQGESLLSRPESLVILTLRVQHLGLGKKCRCLPSLVVGVLVFRQAVLGHLHGCGVLLLDRMHLDRMLPLPAVWQGRATRCGFLEVRDLIDVKHGLGAVPLRPRGWFRHP